jgi:hypothetical protein
MPSSSQATPLSRQIARCWFGLGAFSLAIASAIAVYPGGSWSERQSSGFSLLRNFWCDLVRSSAINGEPNGASRALASLAFAALAFALWQFWGVASWLLEPARRERVRRLGRISTLGLVGMSILPSDAHPVLHGVVALAGAGLGMLCAFACLQARPAGELRWSARRCWAALALAAAAANAALYVYVAYFEGPETPAQPSVQKLATLALLLWMASTLRSAECMRAAGAIDPSQ